MSVHACSLRAASLAYRSPPPFNALEILRDFTIMLTLNGKRRRGIICITSCCTILIERFLNRYIEKLGVLGYEVMWCYILF